MILNKVVGWNIRKRREELGLTQEEAAHRAVVAVSFYGQVERGELNPSISKLADISEALDLPLIALFEGYAKSRSS